jgi:CRP-like cAMP-binding protein
MRCPVCLHDNPAGSRFCNACGGGLVVPGGPVAAAPPASGPEAALTADALGFLGRLRPFEAFGPDELALLAGAVRRLSLPAGRVLFREGEPGGEMYFVRAGTVLISKLVAAGIENVLARMGPGDFFGEMSLFGQLQRSASAQAETDCVLLALDRDSVLHVIGHSPAAGLAFFTCVVREFTRRLAATDDLVAEVTRWGLEATGLLSELDSR